MSVWNRFIWNRLFVPSQSWQIIHFAGKIETKTRIFCRARGLRHSSHRRTHGSLRRGSGRRLQGEEGSFCFNFPRSEQNSDVCQDRSFQIRPFKFVPSNRHRLKRLLLSGLGALGARVAAVRARSHPALALQRCALRPRYELSNHQSYLLCCCLLMFHETPITCPDRLGTNTRKAHRNDDAFRRRAAPHRVLHRCRGRLLLPEPVPRCKPRHGRDDSESRGARTHARAICS